MTVHSMPLPQEAALEDAQRTKLGRWKMFAVLLVCAAPVVASYFTYYVVRPETRLGIAAARNLGASRSRWEVLVFSDAHVDVPPGFLGPLLDELRRPGVAAVGPAVSTRDDPNSKGYGFRWRDAALNIEWLPRQGAAPYPVPMLVGRFLAARRDAFEAVGPADLHIFVRADDVLGGHQVAVGRDEETGAVATAGEHQDHRPDRIGNFDRACSLGAGQDQGGLGG